NRSAAKYQQNTNILVRRQVRLSRSTLSDTSSQTPKPRKMDNSKATEDSPPSQDTLATLEARFPTPENSDAHQVSWKQFLGDTGPHLLFTCLFYNKQRVWNVGIPGHSPAK
ncbi:hypothetical protein A6R68_11811, partial [Neotoma lepida]